MKKMNRFAAVLAAVCALCMLASVLTVSAQDLKVEKPSGTVDIIEGFDGIVQSRGQNGFLSEVNSNGTNASGLDVLTDGTYTLHFHDGGKPLSYLNIPVCGSSEPETYDKAGGDYSFPGVDKKYYYSIEYKDVYSDAASFAMYFSNEKNYAADGTVPVYQIDASFDILVSTDGGSTYKVAWSSVDYVIDENRKNGNGYAAVVRCAGMSYDKGGNMVEAYVTDENGKQVPYKYVIANFDQSYTNVTNIVYACSNLRRNGNQDKAFYYCARISEFDVYNTALGANVLTPASVDPVVVTTAASTTASTPESTEYPIITAAPVTTAKPADTTKAPETTTTAAPAVTDTPETKAEEKKSGCGSSVSAVCTVAIACACAYVLKKKH